MKLDNYNANRDLIKTGDMLEWRSNSLLGKAIRLFTKKKVNHTGMVYINEVDGVKHLFTIEAQLHGLEFNLLSRQLSEFDGEVYWSKLRPEMDSKRLNGVGWLLEQIGRPYDFKSLFKNIAGAVSADAQKLFCSEAYFFYLVISGMIKGLYFYNNDVYRIGNKGKTEKAPRPGEFGKFNIHEPPIKL